MPSRASTPSSTPFRGLSAFPVTPADAQGRVEAGALARLVRRLAEAGADSIGLLGSTGTYAYLSRAERRRAIEAAREAAGKVPLIVGAGALRTDDCRATYAELKAKGVEMTEEPEERFYGVDAAFRDPFGNHWRLTQPRTLDEIRSSGAARSAP